MDQRPLLQRQHELSPNPYLERLLRVDGPITITLKLTPGSTMIFVECRGSDYHHHFQFGELIHVVMALRADGTMKLVLDEYTEKLKAEHNTVRKMLLGSDVDFDLPLGPTIPPPKIQPMMVEQISVEIVRR